MNTTIQFSVNGHEFTVEPYCNGWRWGMPDVLLVANWYETSREAQQAAIDYGKGLSNE